MSIAETKEQVRAWFDAHPAAKAKVESTEIQTKIGADPCYRKMTVDDVRFIEQGGWYGEPGIFAWFYPCGVPNYMCVEEPPAIVWPEDHEYHSPETYRQMRARHEAERDGLHGRELFDKFTEQHDEIMNAMWDEQFAHDAFVSEMFNVEYGYAQENCYVFNQFCGAVTTNDVEHGIAELGLPKRICEVYRKAAREVIEYDPD